MIFTWCARAFICKLPVETFAMVPKAAVPALEHALVTKAWRPRKSIGCGPSTSSACLPWPIAWFVLRVTWLLILRARAPMRPGSESFRTGYLLTCSPIGVRHYVQDG